MKTIEAIEFESLIEPDQLREMVAQRAYLKAESRNFEEGHELEDWLEAEKEIVNQISFL